MLYLTLRLLRDGTELVRGSIVVTASESVTPLGVFKDASLVADGRREEYRVFEGLVVEHHVEGQGAMLLLKVYEAQATSNRSMPLEQVRRLRSATLLPIGYDSEGEESMTLAEGYELAFSSRWFDTRLPE